MKDIILAGTNAHSRTYQQIGECLENAPDLNHSGKPKVHVIGDKASLDKALTDNVIDAVIFVAEEIPASEVSKQELIPVDVELLDELTSLHPNVSFIAMVKEIERSSQKLLRFYMHKHFNVLYRDEVAQSVTKLVKLIRSDRTEDEAFQYCALEGVPLEADTRKRIYKPNAALTKEADEADDEIIEEETVEDIGIDFEGFDDFEEEVEEPPKKEPSHKERKPEKPQPKVEDAVPEEEEEEIGFLPPKRKPRKEEPKVTPKPEVKKSEAPKAEKPKNEKPQSKESTVTEATEGYKLTLPAAALEMIRLEVVSVDEYELLLRIPEGHTLNLPNNIKDTPSVCVLLNKR